MENGVENNNGEINFCPECGSTTMPNAKFCKSCGAKLNAPATPAPTPTPTPTQQNTCPECGAPCHETQIICAECGFPLKKTEPPTPTPAVDYNSTEAQEPEPTADYGYNEEEEKKVVAWYQKPLYIIIMIIVVLGIIAYCFSLANSNSNTSYSLSESDTVSVDTEFVSEVCDIDTVGSVYYVLADRIWFRSTPEINSYNKITLIYYGKELTLVEKEGDWLKVEADGVAGYVNTGFVANTQDFLRYSSMTTSKHSTLKGAYRTMLIDYSKRKNKIGDYDSEAINRVKHDNTGLNFIAVNSTEKLVGNDQLVSLEIEEDGIRRLVTYKLFDDGSIEYAYESNL
ncbi:MAG: zinc ribbon domain-containing protein [Muribaculaceae bacterium]|nr:zinc ribbon domain-containing protein [Muribaculaceae bacterium]